MLSYIQVYNVIDLYTLNRCTQCLRSGGLYQTERKDSMTTYRTLTVDGIPLFYREAGPVDAPTLVLLHGFPSSSHMFRDLLPALSKTLHLVAPDYPGFG